MRQTFELVARPRHASQSNAQQLRDVAVVEVTIGPPAARRMFHAWIGASPIDAQVVLVERFAASGDPLAIRECGMLDEVLATAPGSGLVRWSSSSRTTMPRRVRWSTPSQSSATAWWCHDVSSIPRRHMIGRWITRRISTRTAMRRRTRALGVMNAAIVEHVGTHDEGAVGALDQVDLHALSPWDIAHWLNARAYALGLMGCTTEALEHLRDAEELLTGIEDTEPVPAEHVERLVSCIIGTRGIALLHGGSLDEAEAHLERALALGASQLENASADMLPDQQRLAAERLWWLAMIAEKRGDTAHRLHCLRRASQFRDMRYGAEACKALGDDA